MLVIYVKYENIKNMLQPKQSKLVHRNEHHYIFQIEPQEVS